MIHDATTYKPFAGRRGFDLVSTPRLLVLLRRYEAMRHELNLPANKRAWPTDARKSGLAYCAEIEAEIGNELASRGSETPGVAA